MCNKRNTTRIYIQNRTVRVDACLKHIIDNLNELGVQTVGSCCGHGKYPMTILVRYPKGVIFELFSNAVIPRTRNFYKTDKDGYYFIPEVSTGESN